MRNRTIDGIKAIAIVAVLLYHMGLLSYGFLGVDVFFVIGGYFATKSLMKGKSILSFISNRIKRLFPAVLLAGIVCLSIGCCGMLPDDFENVAEQIIASNFLSENILSAITTSNYWDVVNDYKPLMHMWYVGVLFEFYILFPFAYRALEKVKHVFSGITCLTIISLLLYLMPFISSSYKFYLLPFRLFEFGVGALISLKNLKRDNKQVFYLSTGLLLFLILANKVEINPQVRLIGTVLLSGIILVSCPKNEFVIGNKAFAVVGQRSYSIFVWHQIILAFYRYFFSSKITVIFVVLYFIAVAVVTEVSYQFIEKKLCDVSMRALLVFCSILFFISCGASGYIYIRAGVVRDIPELDLYTSDVHRGMHAEYCDRIYSYNHEFQNNGRPKVLVVGNSFARDWANILIEFGLPIDLTYSNSVSEELIPRIKEADFIFYRDLYEKIPDYGFDTTARIYGISTKNFGESNGIIYKNRGSDDYFSQTVRISDDILNEYYEQKSKWGEDNYIDMIKPVEVSDGVVRVFTDDQKFISQDCRHLTQAGARYYARQMDIKSILVKGD